MYYIPKCIFYYSYEAVRVLVFVLRKRLLCVHPFVLLLYYEYLFRCGAWIDTAEKYLLYVLIRISIGYRLSLVSPRCVSASDSCV